MTHVITRQQEIYKNTQKCKICMDPYIILAKTEQGHE